MRACTPIGPDEIGWTSPLARHTVEDLGDRLVVHLRSRRAWGLVVWLSFFFALWTIGGCAILVHFVETTDLGAVFFLAFWTFSEALLVYGIADELFGSETLIVTPERSIFDTRSAGFHARASSTPRL
jgi:hypothetical protein